VGGASWEKDEQNGRAHAPCCCTLDAAAARLGARLRPRPRPRHPNPERRLLCSPRASPAAQRALGGRPARGRRPHAAPRPLNTPLPPPPGGLTSSPGCTRGRPARGRTRSRCGWWCERRPRSRRARGARSPGGGGGGGREMVGAGLSAARGWRLALAAALGAFRFAARRRHGRRRRAAAGPPARRCGPHAAGSQASAPPKSAHLGLPLALQVGGVDGGQDGLVAGVGEGHGDGALGGLDAFAWGWGGVGVCGGGGRG
jgi:hypothetical protein